MQLIEWKNDYNLGVNTIEEHHQQLINLINKSYNAIQLNNRQHIELILNELVDYTKYHLSTEEHFMHKYNYYSIDEHEIEHSLLCTKISELQFKIIANEALHHIDIVTFFKEWLMDHILVTDKELAAYLITKGVDQPGFSNNHNINLG